MTIYGPHCSHEDLCSWFGCDQRGHIDYPCREQATCTYCGTGARCPMNSAVSAAACPDCHVGTTEAPTSTPAPEADEWDGPGCCEHAEEEECHCEDDGDPDDCFRCGGSGYYVREHCCDCGGSPYCNCCGKCGSSSVGRCSCPITVPLVDGTTTTV